MGVTYKIKSDVVVFIQAQKKDSPALSCRQLAELASQKFQIEVSKSSVNSILKESHLSSPIGRRFLGKQKFEIPPEKKHQIVENLKKVSSYENLIEKPKTPLLIAQVPPVDQLPVEQKKEEEKPIVLKETPFKVPKEPDVAPPTGLPQSLKGMGLAVLKAAQWETIDHHILEELFKKYSSSPLPQSFEALIFLEMLELSTGRMKDEDKETLKAFHDNFEDSWMQDHSRLAREKISENFFFNYLLEKERMFLEVSGFRFFLEDKTQFFIDSQWASVWNFNMPRITTPLDRALSRLSRVFVSNRETPFLIINAPAALSSQGVKDFIACCENISGKRVQAISVLDKTGEETARFSHLPLIRRNYAINVWPAQTEFEELTRAVQWSAKKSFEKHGFYQKIFYTETKTNFLSKLWNPSFPANRVLTLYDEESHPLVALLTNDTQTQAENFIEAYFLRWPNFDQSPFSKFEAASSPKIESQVMPAPEPVQYFRELLQDLADSVLRYSLRFFESHDQWTPRDLVAALKEIDGSVQKDQEKTLVSWNVPQSAHRNRLVHGARAINERDIRNPQGKKLLIQIPQ